MNIVKTEIEGLLVLEPTVHGDKRGYFYESYSKRDLQPYIGDVEFVQDNESRSSFGVLRGLHFQRPPHSQAKLVRCTEGKVLDIAVDIRKGSPTYGQHFSVELSEENRRQIFIPAGFAHGFSVLSPSAVIQYKCDHFYAPEADGGINPLDPALQIDWQIDPSQAILSAKDTGHPALSDLDNPF